MKRLLAIVLFTAILGCARSAPAGKAFDAAQQAAGENKYGRARDLYLDAAKSDPDRKQRDRALIAATNIQWRVFHDAPGARATLGRVLADSSVYTQSLVERARVDAELAHDYSSALQKVHAAMDAAKKRDEKRRALVAEAIVTIEPLLRDRRAQKCTSTDALADIDVKMKALIEKNGPLLSPVGRLFDAAVLRGDGPTMLQAWRWYYGDLLPAPAATLARVLPAWRGSAASTSERRELGVALAQSRMFAQAELVLRDPCASEPLPHDAEVDAIVAYADSLRRIRDIADEYYRTVAAGDADVRAFRKAVSAELRKNGDDALLRKRFGTVVTTGKTGGVEDLHFGHTVIDEQRPVEQYGRTATLRFVALDGIVSNGYLSWAADGRSGDGGWAADGVIYQVRPLYADGPVRLWLSVADPEIRAQADEEMAEQTKRDEELAAVQPIRTFEGLESRMLRQDAERIFRDAHGDRDSFLSKARDEKFATSIWAHEGRHAIDQKYERLKDAEELEYRAKLSEVALTPAPRNALYGGILGDVGSPTPHGRANSRVCEGVTAWMRAHAREIAGLDVAKPLLPQLDKLSDEQLRAAFRSLDPFADGVTASR
jgi:hypothetical protein